MIRNLDLTYISNHEQKRPQGFVPVTHTHPALRDPENNADNIQISKPRGRGPRPYSSRQHNLEENHFESAVLNPGHGVPDIAAHYDTTSKMVLSSVPSFNIQFSLYIICLLLETYASIRQHRSRGDGGL